MQDAQQGFERSQHEGIPPQKQKAGNQSAQHNLNRKQTKDDIEPLFHFDHSSYPNAGGLGGSLWRIRGSM